MVTTDTVKGWWRDGKQQQVLDWLAAKDTKVKDASIVKEFIASKGFVIRHNEDGSLKTEALIKRDDGTIEIPPKKKVTKVVKSPKEEKTKEKDSKKPKSDVVEAEMAVEEFNRLEKEKKKAEKKKKHEEHLEKRKKALEKADKQIAETKAKREAAMPEILPEEEVESSITSNVDEVGKSGMDIVSGDDLSALVTGESVVPETERAIAEQKEEEELADLIKEQKQEEAPKTEEVKKKKKVDVEPEEVEELVPDAPKEIKKKVKEIVKEETKGKKNKKVVEGIETWDTEDATETKKTKKSFAEQLKETEAKREEKAKKSGKQKHKEVSVNVSIDTVTEGKKEVKKFNYVEPVIDIKEVRALGKDKLKVIAAEEKERASALCKKWGYRWYADNDAIPARLAKLDECIKKKKAMQLPWGREALGMLGVEVVLKILGNLDLLYPPQTLNRIIIVKNIAEFLHLEEIAATMDAVYKKARKKNWSPPVFGGK